MTGGWFSGPGGGGGVGGGEGEGEGDGDGVQALPRSSARRTKRIAHLCW